MRFYAIKNNLCILFVIIIILIYSYLNWCGYFGFGNDFYAAYYKKNLVWGNIFDKLGYKVSTYAYKNIHLGVFLVSLSTSTSLFILLKNFWKSGRINFLFLISSYCLLLFSWPIIMSNSNAMRQGLCMSAIFVSISIFEQRKLFALLFLSTSIFLHKSGIFYLIIFFLAYLFSLMRNNINLQRLIIKLFLFFSLLLVICLQYYNIESSRVIGRDFSPFFVLINYLFVIIGIFSSRYLNRKNLIYNFLLLYNLITPLIYFFGYTWQYERIQMMIIIPNCLWIFSILFRGNLYKISILSYSFLFFIITFLTGMFDSLK